jgi:hypothetical protein
MFAGLRDLLIFSNAGGLPGTWSVISTPIFAVWGVQVAIQTPFFGNGRVFLMVRNPTTMTGGVYYSDNPPGVGWSLMQGLAASDTLVSMAILSDTADGEAVYAGTFSGRVYKALLPFGGTPSTFSLVYESSELESVNAFDEIDIEIGNDGVLPPGKRKKAAKSGGRRRSIIAPQTLGSVGGVIETLDDGLTWQDNNDGLPADRIMTALASHVTSSNSAVVYAGMFLDQNDGGPVYSLEVVTTDVDPEAAVVPGAFALHQNHPNPFNPTTFISYELPVASHMTLKIYNILGQEVATLVDGIQEAGYWRLKWNSTGVSSGVYLYKLEAQVTTTSQMITGIRKMVVMK